MKHAPKKSRAQLLEAGARAIAAHGITFTANQLQRLTGVKPGSVHYAFGGMDEFRAALGVKGAARDPDTDARASIAAERVRVKAAAERKVLKNELADAEERATVAEARLEAATALAGRASAEIKVTARKGGLPEATYFMLASDWHVGERVRASEVGWRNEYTPAIATVRAEQFFRSNLTMMQAARSAWSIDTAVLWIGGDLCTGWIHEEYVSENYLTPLEEMALAYDLLEKGIRFLLAHGDLARLVIPTSNGNHGRSTAKMHSAGGFRNSYEFALYKQLAARFADEPRVTFQLGEGYYNDLTVYGEVARFSHGDGVKSGGGVGGISVPFNRRMGREALSGPRILVYCHGHFHQYDPGRTRVGNGSLIGWNGYADRGGFGFEQPLQASFVIDAKHRIVSNLNPILVDKAKK